MTIHPQHDRILIRRDEAEGITKGGIILPDQQKEKPLRGIIVAIGPGKRLASPLVPRGYMLEPIDFAIGQHVLFLKYAGDSYKFDGEELFFVKADDIIAIIDPDDAMDAYVDKQLGRTEIKQYVDTLDIGNGEKAKITYTAGGTV